MSRDDDSRASDRDAADLEAVADYLAGEITVDAIVVPVAVVLFVVRLVRGLWRERPSASRPATR